MDLIKKLLLSLFFVGFFFSPTSQAQTDNNFFYGESCPHCHDVLEYFDETKALDYFDLNLREVWSDRSNARIFINQMAALGEPLNSLPVPIMIFNDRIFNGSKEIIGFFETQKSLGLWSPPKSAPPQISEPINPDFISTHTFWGFLPTLSLAAIADAVNPCAFAVLILLLISILASGNRTQVLKAGLSFSLAIFLSYLAMGFGLYSALATFTSTQIIGTVAAILAIILGLFNLKDAFWYGKGNFKMEVPMKWRTKMKLILAQITSPFGAFLAGFIISLFLLPCTSGPYIVILGLLSEQATFTCAVQCLFTYNAIFVAPMILITLAVFWGLDPHRVEAIRAKHLKSSHFIIGILLITIGLWALLG